MHRCCGDGGGNSNNRNSTSRGGSVSTIILLVLILVIRIILVVVTTLVVAVAAAATVIAGNNENGKPGHTSTPLARRAIARHRYVSARGTCGVRSSEISAYCKITETVKPLLSGVIPVGVESS